MFCLEFTSSAPRNKVLNSLCTLIVDVTFQERHALVTWRIRKSFRNCTPCRCSLDNSCRSSCRWVCPLQKKPWPSLQPEPKTEFSCNSSWLSFALTVVDATRKSRDSYDRAKPTSCQ